MPPRSLPGRRRGDEGGDRGFRLVNVKLWCNSQTCQPWREFQIFLPIVLAPPLHPTFPSPLFLPPLPLLVCLFSLFAMGGTTYPGSHNFFVGMDVLVWVSVGPFGYGYDKRSKSTLHTYNIQDCTSMRMICTSDFFFLCTLYDRKMTTSSFIPKNII